MNPLYQQLIIGGQCKKLKEEKYQIQSEEASMKNLARKISFTDRIDLFRKWSTMIGKTIKSIFVVPAHTQPRSHRELR